MADNFDLRSKIDATWPNESELSMALAAPIFAFLHFAFSVFQSPDYFLTALLNVNQTCIAHVLTRP